LRRRLVPLSPGVLAADRDDERDPQEREDDVKRRADMIAPTRTAANTRDTTKS